jgi:starch phosphorylase
MRIKQEIILGIGGWKLLRAIGINPEVCHLNEGHAAFLVLERARDFMKENGTTFEEALAVTRAGNLFTTHTAVSAGFDRFNPDLMHQYLGSYAQDELNISFDDLMALGRLDTNNESESFNMAYLAIRGSGGVNGVSRLHGEVSRNLFQNLFPRWPVAEVPVGYVTNGVHMPCWDSKLADDLWTEACGKDRWRGDLENLEQHISGIADEKLWQFRNESRSNLVSFIRERFERQSMIADLSPNIVEAAKQVFNPDVLTLGFARRFVPYKRATLLLHDPERFIQILTNREQPVQLVIAGKAPPYDESGKALIRQWIQFIQQHQLYNHVIFLSDYDTHMAENLVQGVDVWVNTPRRPWEASGTSGMKVLVNGGLNVSTLDGWWAEAYTPEVGWALGDMQEQTGDASEADALYSLLEQQVIPEFYTRNEKGMPQKWIEKMRKSMATLAPRFSANRTVREYTEKYYLPVAENYVNRAGNKGETGRRIANIKSEMRTKWSDIHFGEEKVESIENGYAFNIDIVLNGLDQSNISVELFAEGHDKSLPEKIKMQPVPLSGNGDKCRYEAIIHTTRPANDYTVRIVPGCENISEPLEDNLILWQR